MLDNKMTYIDKILIKVGNYTTGHYKETCICGGSIDIVVKEGAMLNNGTYVSGKCSNCNISFTT